MVPLNWRLRAGELANLLRRCAARAIFVEERFLGTILELRRSGELPDLRTVITLDGTSGDNLLRRLRASAGGERPTRSGRLTDPHEIIFTSGTTGNPKGVVWTNGTLLWNALQQVTDFQLGPQHSTYAIIDLYYIGGRHDTSPGRSSTRAGPSTSSASSGFDAEEVVRLHRAGAHQPRAGVPTMLYEILRLPTLGEHDLSCLKMIMCGGQPVSVATTERAQRLPADRLHPGLRPHRGRRLGHLRAPAGRAREARLGRQALPARRDQAARPQRAEVPTGAEGEIVVRAPSVTAGYWDDPERTGAADRQRLAATPATWAASTTTASSSSPAARAT